MKHERLIKEIEKLGLEVKQPKYCNGNPSFYAEGEEYICSWYKQDDNAICVNLRRDNDHHDYQSDYTAGFFADTYKEVKKYLGYGKERVYA